MVILSSKVFCLLGGKGPYNWLTQSSLDTYAADFNLTLPTNTQSESSLLFTIGKSTTKKSTNKRLIVYKRVGQNWTWMQNKTDITKCTHSMQAIACPTGISGLNCQMTDNYVKQSVA